MTRFPGVEATILKALVEEGEVRPPEERLAQEYFWMAAAALQARGLCVADQKRGIVLPVSSFVMADSRNEDPQRAGDLPYGTSEQREAVYALRERLAAERDTADARRRSPAHNLRARCALLVQRWRQAAERRGAEHRGAGEGSVYLQAAIDLEEVLGETEVKI